MSNVRRLLLHTLTSSRGMSFFVYELPESHIDFLSRHQGSICAYVDGEKPEESTASLPEGWPTEPLHTIVALNANHRNVELYHWILNGSPALVRGGEAIFQTWFKPDDCSLTKLDGGNEAFGISASQVKRLANLTSDVDLARVKAAFSGWCLSEGKDYVPDEPACVPFVDEFNAFGRRLTSTILKQYGLVCAPW